MWWHTRRNHISSFRRNGRVHLNRRGRQFSRLLAAELCASALVMLDTPCSEIVWRVLATHCICQIPLSRTLPASTCAITFQLESNTVWCFVCFWMKERSTVMVGRCGQPRRGIVGTNGRRGDSNLLALVKLLTAARCWKLTKFHAFMYKILIIFFSFQASRGPYAYWHFRPVLPQNVFCFVDNLSAISMQIMGL